jgi:hypothetical protein
MDSYLPKVQYHAEHAWHDRHTTANPALSQVPSLLRAYELEQRRSRTPRTSWRTVVARWAGTQLIAGGHRRAGGPPARA